MRSRAGTLAVATLCACAPLTTGAPAASRPPAVSAPGPVAVTTAEVTALAEILAAEDARDPEIRRLRPHLSSTSALVRARAARAVGANRLHDGVAMLLELVADHDTAVAASAVFALGQIADSSAAPALAALIAPPRDPSRVTVAAEAAYALGKIGDERGRAALRRYLEEADPRTHGSLLARSALLAIWRFPREDREDPLARWLGSPDPELRWRAAYAMVRRPDPGWTPLLLHAVEDADERVRALAVRGLARPLADSAGVGSAVALPAVLGRVGDPAYIVRINAIGALGTYTDLRSVAALRSILVDGRPHERFAASGALGRLGEAASAAAATLDAVARDPDVPVALRRSGLEALARVAPARAAAAARALRTASEWRLRAAAAGVIAAAGGPDAAEAGGLLHDPDGRVAAAALQAVVLASGDSLEALRPLLVASLREDDVGVRVAALRALGKLGDAGTLPAILDAYGEAVSGEPNDAATAAVAALAALRSERLDPARAFFARFSAPPDPLVHRLAVESFGEAAIRAWGPATPIDTGRDADDYQVIVRRRMFPALQRGDSTVALLETESGTITLRLRSADAPLTVESFARLAASGYFDGQEWPRVVPNFVVQGGDPRGDSEGGPGYSIRDEISRYRYGTGTLGMALAGPDTGGSQFFITHSPQPHLDGIYATFGEVVDGIEVTRRILPGERILSIRVR